MQAAIEALSFTMEILTVALSRPFISAKLFPVGVIDVSRVYGSFVHVFPRLMLSACSSFL